MSAGRTVAVLAALLLSFTALGVKRGPAVPPALAAIASTAATAAPQPGVAADIVPFLRSHCYTCHGSGKNRGEVSLDGLATESDLGADRAVWDAVLKAVRNGEMPPKEKPRPDAGEAERFVRSLDAILARVDCGGPRNPGRVTVRRLNRTEYQSTVRDLLYVPNFTVGGDFPPDDIGYGFDNIGDVLSLSPALLERYLKAAEQAMMLTDKSAKQSKARGQMVEPRKLFEDVQTIPLEFNNYQQRARIVLESFVPRAYRRPARPGEIDRLMEFVRFSLAHEGESFDRPRATYAAMRAVLVSPHFLFRVETDPPVGAGPVSISEYELATRLSYFLWSTMPDDELFALAGQGRLRAELENQVRRMLKNPKARALTDNFMPQWLKLRGLKTFAPDPALYPGFDEPLRRAMAEETARFFENVVAEDRPITDFLDADYTFVNEVLAKHYGIEGVTGEEFRKVRLDPEQRGGVLTQASVLTTTSTPVRPSPVKRGVWVLDVLFNTPPAPPPPNTPELEADGKKLTGSFRQVMQKHRESQQCAGCHSKFDPMGLALENFDALGRWRSDAAGVPIDASGVLNNGQSFKSGREFRAVLAGRKADFRRGLTEKLLTYALGRGLDFYDRCAVDAICAATAGDGDKFSSLVLAAVRSDPFQLRGGQQEKK
jgi:mono/diheme cytochrome c family protein